MNMTLTTGGCLKMDMPAFWRLYDAEAAAGLPPRNLTQLTKKEPSMLRFDIDFKQPIEGGLDDRWYDGRDVETIRDAVSDAVRACCPIDGQPKRIVCCLFEKRKRVGDGDPAMRKDGVHLMYPHLLMPKHLRRSIYERVKTRMQEYDPKRIEVDNVVATAWLTLGSAKKKDADPDTVYRFSRIFNNDVEMMLHKDVVEYYSRPSVYCVNKPPGDLDEVIDAPIQANVTRKRKLGSIDSASTTSEFENLLDKVERDEILAHLDPSRTENYTEWLDVGIVLYSISQGSEKALDMWDEWSKQGASYKPDCCRSKWRSFSSCRRSIGSLYYLLHMDDEEYYNKIVYSSNRSFIDSMVNTSLNADPNKLPRLTNCDVAEVFKRLSQHEFIYASIGGKSGAWYVFSPPVHKWERLADIEIHIRDTVKPHLNKIIDDLALEDKERTVYLSKFKERAAVQLGGMPFLGGCAAAARCIMRDPGFLPLLDSNKRLIGCKNGVLDMNTKEFRDGRPDDYISLCTNIHFPDCVSKEDRDELREYFRKLFPETVDDTGTIVPDERGAVPTNVMEILSSILFCNQKRIIISLGSTNVGKTQFIRLIEETIGEYKKTLPKEILTQKGNNSSSAKPDLNRIRGSRVVIVNELSEKASFNTSTLKEISGRDTIFARGLFEDGSEMKATWTIWISTNGIPKIPPDEDAVWQRILILKFSSKFEDDAPDDLEEQYRVKRFKRVSDMDVITRRLAPVLLYTMFETVCDKPYLLEEMVKPCAKFYNDTQEYIRGADPMYMFLNAKDIVEDPSRSIELTYIQSIFHEWYAYSYRGKEKFDQRTFRIAFENATELKFGRRYMFALKKSNNRLQVSCCKGLCYSDDNMCVDDE